MTKLKNILRQRKGGGIMSLCLVDMETQPEALEKPPFRPRICPQMLYSNKTSFLLFPTPLTFFENSTFK